MDGMVIGIVVNIAMVAFGFGKLWQKSNDNCRRLDRIEKKLDNLNNDFDKEKKG